MERAEERGRGGAEMPIWVWEVVGDGAAGADAGQSGVWFKFTSKLGESFSRVNGTPFLI